jgi:6-bladed beta-propeller
MRVIGLLSIVGVVACASADTPLDEIPTELPVIEVVGPTLEIGRTEGDENYLFAQIASVLRLPDGTVAVSDGGTSRISIYDQQGSFLRSWGSKGEGPGEFRKLSRLYPKGSDSIMAADRSTNRVASFSLDGGFGGLTAAEELSGDSIFKLDSWLYRRFWIDGALDESARAGVRFALDRLAPPRSPPGYRRVRLTRDGRLWILEPSTSTSDRRTWIRVDASGRPDAIIHGPSGFDPLDIVEDGALGRWTGEYDVQFVRAYRLIDSGTTAPTPAWLSTTGPDASASGDDAPDETEMRDMIRSVIKSVASAQEIHYSSNMTYTTDLAALEIERPEGLEIDFAVANARGWAGVFTHPDFDRLCGLGYGFVVPPGWVPGMIVCAPEATPPTQKGS